jgi:putative Mg2+ transporter-C (MgtC) family protein
MFDWILDINWERVGFHLIQLLIAYVLVLPVGLDREQSDRSFGLRTFPLIAVVTCGFMLVGRVTLAGSDAEARAFQGIVTGIGFLGGGAIFKGQDRVIGTATATSIWNCGAIGISIAYHRLEIALVLAVINFATLRWVSRVKGKLTGTDRSKK